VLNQTPTRGPRVTNAATALDDKAALDVSGVLAQPFIVMRNDHQDALSAGLAVSEYAPASKSADEVRCLWQWVETKLNAVEPNSVATADEQQIISELPASPDTVPTVILQTPTETAAVAR
jgi:chromosome partitioning protein